MEFPLISACVDGDLSLLKTYIGFKADVEVTNSKGQTGLMIACQKGFHEIVNYLIQSGADVNRKDSIGMNALHHCAKSTNWDCLKLLVESGAAIHETYVDRTILQWTVEDGQANIVEYLIGTSSYSLATKIEALELLGAVCVDKQRRDSAYKYWLMALEKRSSAEPDEQHQLRCSDFCKQMHLKCPDFCKQVQLKCPDFHTAYGNAREFQTVEELNRIASSEEDMWIQAFIVMERILGSQHHLTANCLERSLTIFNNHRNFERCFFIRLYDLQLKLAYHGPLDDGPTRRSLHLLVDLFVKGIDDGLPIKCEYVMSGLTKIVHMIELALKRYVVGSTVYYGILPLFSPCIFKLIDFLAEQQPAMAENDQHKLRTILIKIVNLNLHDARGLTPLHFACQYNYRYVVNWSPFQVAKLLLEAGADPNAVDHYRNTPLHRIAKVSFSSRNVDLMKLLLNHGAHYDACNAESQCFTDYLPSATINEFGNPRDYCKLQCLSAAAVLNHNIPYKFRLPSKLVKFVNLHSSSAMFVSAASKCTNKRASSCYDED